MKSNLTSIAPFLVLILAFSLHASEKKLEIGIDEKLGNKIPLETIFSDENGNELALKDMFNKPTALAFVYYSCPGICTPLMSSIAEVVNNVDMKPGEDYNIISISMDEFETPELALDKKKNYMKLIEKEFPENSWKFLTGDSVSIRTVSDAAGFYFKREGKDFIHSGALIFIGKDGTISRYLFPQYSDRRGYSILPFDFKMAIIETSEGKITPTIARMLQFCFSYDPEGQTYVLNFTRIFGAGILILAAVFIVYLRSKPKENRKTR
jgi:protein SCO1